MAGEAQKPITDEISASASRDLYAGYITPDEVAEKQSAGKGLKLYEEMEDKDGHIASVVQTRKLALTGREWGVEPASDNARDKRIAEFVRQNLKRINFTKILFEQLDALMKGFSVAEILWLAGKPPRATEIVFGGFKHRMPWRFRFGEKSELRLLTESNALDGEPMPECKFWVYSFQGRYGNPYGKPLGQRLYWPYWFKKNTVKWWTVFNEKFGSPTVTGKYPPGTTKTQQDTLLKALDAIQQEQSIVFPNDMEVAILEAARRGSFETYSGFIFWCESVQSKVALGQTLTTQEGEVGARALGQVHDEVRGDILSADADDICESLNAGPIRWLVDYNFSGVESYPQVWIRTEKERDLKPLAERDKIIHDMGYRPTQEYIETTYQIQVERSTSAGSFAARFAGGGCPHCNGSSFAETGDVSPTQDPIVERLMAEAGLEAFIEPVARLLEESTSLEEFRDKLLDVYADMDPVKLGDLLQRAFTVADLAGRYEAQQGD